MGLFDQVVGAIAGGNRNAENPLVGIVMQLITNQQGGGLGGLLQSLQQGGLGDIVNSWVSTGQNQPVSGEQLQGAIDPAMLGDIAGKLGISQEEASGQLAQLLPQIVDHLTPNGQIPEGDLTQQGLALLKGKLFG